jgi:hypothetical protein
MSKLQESPPRFKPKIVTRTGGSPQPCALSPSFLILIVRTQREIASGICEDRGRNTEYVMDMTFNKKLLLLSWAMSFVLVCSAQDKKSAPQTRPDLTGTWERNLSKSKRGNRAVGTAVVRLIISHNDPELKVTRQSDSIGKETITDSVYYTDGRGEKNVTGFSGVVRLGLPYENTEPNQGGSKDPEVRSRTKWEGDKLVSRYSMSFSLQGRRADLDVAEKRELSPDGKTLTIVTLFMPGRTTLTEVFDRIQ